MSRNGVNKPILFEIHQCRDSGHKIDCAIGAKKVLIQGSQNLPGTPAFKKTSVDSRLQVGNLQTSHLFSARKISEKDPIRPIVAMRDNRDILRRSILDDSLRPDDAL